MKNKSFTQTRTELHTHLMGMLSVKGFLEFLQRYTKSIYWPLDEPVTMYTSTISIQEILLNDELFDEAEKMLSVTRTNYKNLDKYYEYLSKSKNVITNIIFETKAENKYLSVATASIIARYFFLKEIEKISKESGFEIQKGASNKVDIQASQIIKEKGTNYLSQIAKLNFKNFDKAKKILNTNEEEC